MYKSEDKLTMSVYLIGTGDVLRQKWKQDVTDRLEFMKDQKANGELLTS